MFYILELDTSTYMAQVLAGKCMMVVNTGIIKQFFDSNVLNGPTLVSPLTELT